VSAQAITGASSGLEAGELAAAQRVQQLQALIVAAGSVGSASPTGANAASYSATQTSPSDFAAALQAATSASSASTADVSYQPAVGASTEGADSSEYEALIEQAAERNGLDPAVLHGLIEQESGFDPSATSSAGAAGLTQLMPGTASSLGVANPLDAAESIEGGARYLGELSTEFGGNTTEALAAYNAGPGAVQQYGGVPPYAETQSYVSKVLGYAEAYRQAHPSSATTGVLS
jgi:soluble lytic murein transglycosylase-like protein